MLDRVEEFATLLRKGGVRVSTSEVIDAARAVAAVGFASSRDVRAALATTLIKRSADVPTFDELYELYFRSGGHLADASGSSLAALLREAGLDDAAIAALFQRLALEAAGLSPMARTGLGLGQADLASLIRAAGAEAELERIASPLQVGYFAYRIMDALDVDGAEGEIAAMLRRLAEGGVLTDAEQAMVIDIARRNLGRLRAAVREHVQTEFKRQNTGFMQRLTVDSLTEKPLGQLSHDEVDKLREEVARLARVLRSRISLAPKAETRGRLDLQRTLRRSLATGGVPFEVVRKRRQRRKPRLVILCDISDSVRNVSRFMLQLAYTLQASFDRVDSFAFVAELGELTELFRIHEIDRALDLAYSGAVCSVFANSNYGSALRAFRGRHLDKVTSRTTVLVIGDGRNNYHPAHADILGDIRRRARQVWWLNPESPAAWGFGDSAMHEYATHCDRVVVVYNLESLRKVVDELVM
jgi:hypothetical protein